MSKITDYLGIPIRQVGPLKINYQGSVLDLKVPLATFETPIWQSVSRGAKVTSLSGGINTVILSDCMTRSVLFETINAKKAAEISCKIDSDREVLIKEAEKTSDFVKLQDWTTQVVGNLLFIRFKFSTGDAAGHNMVTKASEALQSFLIKNYPDLKYVSISGNYCTDKKVSAVNGILGRGKSVVADVLIPRKICFDQLRTTPEKIVELNIKKNLVGSIISGAVRSANAHFANMLLALYLATGQDAANIIEGSQGITYAIIQNDSLYFSVSLPNIIVGSVGSGKDLESTKNNLMKLGCLEKGKPGENARRLASIVAATVLCGEISLLAAQTNPGELMRGHVALERKQLT